jgi:GMP synthase-like glutamine amidotransferase
MQKPVAIFRHVDCEGPGYLEHILESQQIPFNIIAVDEGDAVPEGIDAFSGLVFMGGSMSVNDDLDWITRELQLIRRAVDANLPVLGHCLGGQLIARALGAKVTANSSKEIGWYDVEQTGSPNPGWFEHAPAQFEVFHWHGETFAIPKQAERILGNANCRNQAFAMNTNVLAMQCHIEMTETMVRTWVARFGEQLGTGEAGVQAAEDILENLPLRIEKLNKIAESVYRKWIQTLARSSN